MKKERLDLFLVEQGLFESRSKAQAVIMAGEVLVDDQKIDKPGTMVKPDAKITLLGKKLPFVSRGGYSSTRLLKSFLFPWKEKPWPIWEPRQGALRTVHCSTEPKRSLLSMSVMDSWPGNLETIRAVVNMERTNVRFLEADSLGEQVDAVSIDVPSSL